MTADYFSATTFLFNFSVGVSSPPSTVKSPSIKAHFLTYYALEIALYNDIDIYLVFALSMASSIFLMIIGSFLASSLVTALEPYDLNSLTTSGAS